MNIKKVAAEIIDAFEDLLDRKNVTIPSNDREGNPDEARIYGSEYYELEESIAYILENLIDRKKQNGQLDVIEEHANAILGYLKELGYKETDKVYGDIGVYVSGIYEAIDNML